MTKAQMDSVVLFVRKNVSFLSRGPRGIWKHFKCKSYYRNDRRYRYDHEDVIYTEKMDAVPVSELSTELRAETEATPPVILGKMNNFVEDEVDALVGVPSNVPQKHSSAVLLSF